MAKEKISKKNKNTSTLAKKSFLSIMKSLIPDFKKNYTGTGFDSANSLHFLTVCAAWLVPFFILLSIKKHGMDSISTEHLLGFFSILYSVSGTVWITAGVIYTKPKNLSDSAFRDHVINTFAIASRHCRIGICIFLSGVAIQLLSEHFQENDGKNKEVYSCSVLERTNEETHPSKNYLCVVSSKK